MKQDIKCAAEKDTSYRCRGVGNGKGYSPSRVESEKGRELPSYIRGETPAANVFNAFEVSQFLVKNNTILS